MAADVLVRYEPRGAAREIFGCRASEAVLSGPAGTGKSMACLMRLHLAALANPGIRCLIVRKTAVSLGSTTLVTFEQHVAAEALKAGAVVWFGGNTREAASYRYQNGSRIVVGGLDKPEKVMSSDFDLVFADEATELTITDWETLGTRLRNGRLAWQQQIAACNPDAPTHWIKRRSESGPLVMLESRHEHNPYLFDDDGQLTAPGADYMAKLDALTGVRYQRLRRGIWAAAEGIIYETWDPAVHVIDRFPIPEDWTRWWSVDFGYTNPFVLQRWAEDYDGRLYLYAEQYRTKRLVEDHARDVLAMVAPNGHWLEPRPRAIICDHDAEDRATLERHLGLGTAAAYKAVSDGIQAVQARLNPAGDGRRRLFLLRDALVQRDPDLDEGKLPTCTAEEVAAYAWDRTPGKPPKESPVKRDDHGCLAAGSLVSTEHGPVPVEQVSAGDRVWTRHGLRVVLDAGMTSPAAQTMAVLLSDDSTLVATPDHPIWVIGRGWVRVDTLRYADRLQAWPSESRPSSSTASATGAIPTPPASASAITTSLASQIDSPAERPDCTRTSGARSTAPFPMDTTSTTPMATRSTTTRRTSWRSARTNTRRYTQRRPPSAAGDPRAWTTWIAFARWLLSGIGPKRDERGIEPTQPRPVSVSLNRGRSPASSAGAPSRVDPRMVTSASAPTPARAPGVEAVASTTRNGPAISAAQRSPSIATPGRAAADVRVLSVYALPGAEPVFNLTVEEAPEFFANGVLVHNCDAMRYVAATIERGMSRDPGEYRWSTGSPGR